VILVATASTGHSFMGSAVEWPVPGTGGGLTVMSQRIREWIVMLVPVVAIVFTEFARRWH